MTLATPVEVRSPGAPPREAAARRRALPWVVFALLALVPPLWTGWHVGSNAVDVPFWDAWQFVDTIALDHEEGVPLEQLWLSHNGHRILLPRLVMLGLARLSDWDVRWEQAASLGFALGCLGLLALCIRRSFRGLAPGWSPWLVLVASVLTFSLSQWENWVWGWQVQILMAAFFGALLAWLAARSRGRRRDAALMLGAATGGALCFASGLALFGVVALALLLGPRPLERRERLIQLAAVVAVSAAAAWLFVPEEHVFENLPAARGAWRQPIDLTIFVLAFLGSALTRASVEQAVLEGAFGVGALALVGGSLWLRAPALRKPLLPWLLLAAWAVGSALITGLGRVGYGYAQAIVPRYATFATPLWIALACVAGLGLAWTLRAPAAPGRIRRVALASATAAALGTAAAFLLVEINQQGLDMVREHGLKLAHGRALLRMQAAPPPRSLGILFHDGHVRERAMVLRDLGLSLYDEPAPRIDLGRFERVQTERVSGAVDIVRKDTVYSGCLIVEGWAMDPFTREAAEAVLVTVGGQVVGRTTSGIPREDVREGLGLAPSFRPGWSLHLKAVPPRWLGSELEAYALLPGGRIVPLGGLEVLALE